MRGQSNMSTAVPYRTQSCRSVEQKRDHLGLGSSFPGRSRKHRGEEGEGQGAGVNGKTQAGFNSTAASTLSLNRETWTQPTDFFKMYVHVSLAHSQISFLKKCMLSCTR